jgi:anaphase-promoting complex subunit 8
MVLSKEKNDTKAMEYFIMSVHKFPMNWGCWLEMTSLISRVEDVSQIHGVSVSGYGLLTTLN